MIKTTNNKKVSEHKPLRSKVSRIVFVHGAPWAVIRGGWVPCVGWAQRVRPGDTLMVRRDGAAKLLCADGESEWFQF